MAVKAGSTGTQWWSVAGLLGLSAVLVSCGLTNSRDEKGNQAAGGASGSGGASGAGEMAGSAGTGQFANEPRGSSIYTRTQRLTISQFEHAAIDILGLPPETDLKSGLVPVVHGAATFTNDELVQLMDEKATQAFEEAAEKAAALATGSPDALARLYPGSDATGFVRALGRRAFRRPMTETEVSRYVSMFARGEELYGAGFANGAALVIRAMLQSPSFLYRTELGPTGQPLSGYEIAAKLSFWLLDTTPSDELLDAAATGELEDPAALVATARAMLQQPAAAAVMADFHSQLYGLHRFDQFTNPFAPGWKDAIVPEAREASLRFFRMIFEQDLGVRDIFLSPRGFVGPELARIYAQDIPSVLEERELGPERLGFFMQAPRLMMTTYGAEPSIVSRGSWLLADALCLYAESVPADLPAAPPRKPGQTNREHIAEWTETCGASCHKELLNPLGYAFEGFDALGAARDTDNGQPIDASSTFDGIGAFQDARDLMTKLVEDDRVYSCYSQRLAGYALRRDMTADDQPVIDSLAAAAREGSLKELVLALVADPAFRLRGKDSP